MTTIRVITNIKDAVTGRQVGSRLRTAATISEALVGDRVGRLAPGVYSSIITDVLSGEKVGMAMQSPHIMAEAITGASIGKDLRPIFMNNIVEVVGRESSYRIYAVVNEVLGSAPDDAIKIQWKGLTLREQVSQVRPAWLLPPHLWSWTSVPQYRMQVAQRGHVLRPISAESVLSLRQLTAFQAARPAPPGVFSILRFITVRQQIAKSRTIAYNPVSGNFTYTTREQVAQRKQYKVTTDPSIRSAELLTQLVELVCLSKRVGYQLRVPQVRQLVARQRIVTFSAPTAAKTEQQLVAQQVVRTAPFSSDLYMTQRQQSAMHRVTGGVLRSSINWFTQREQIAVHRDTAGIIRSTTMLFSDVQLVAQARVPTPYRSTDFIAQYSELVAQYRATITYIGDEIVSGLREQIAQHRAPSPLPYTKEQAMTLREQIAMHRETAPPNATSDWRVIAHQAMVGQRRTWVTPRSQLFYQTQRVQYSLRKPYPPPGSVIGPEVGAQLRQQRQLAAQRKHYDAPHDISYAAVVKTLRSVVVYNDAFPVATDAYSDIWNYEFRQHPLVADVGGFAPLDAVYGEVWNYTVQQRIVVADEFLTPLGPQSDAVALNLGQQVALGDDAFPDPALSGSEVIAQNVLQRPVVTDSFPDPALSGSDVVARSVTQQVAMGDVFPDPSTGASSEGIAQNVLQRPVVTDVFPPLSAAFSDLSVQQVAARPVVGDSFPDPLIAQGDLFVRQAVQQAVVTDAFEDPLVAHSDASVRQVAARPVVGDTFLDPLLAGSDLTVMQSAARVVLGDLFDDPLAGHSDLTARNVLQVVAVTDQLPDPNVPVSDLTTVALMSNYAMTDQFPDPALSGAQAQALQLAQQPVVRDLMGDPGLPSSVLYTRLVGAAPLIVDPLFPDPTQPTSTADLQLVMMAILYRDPGLLSIPTRTDRRRAVVTVSIS